MADGRHLIVFDVETGNLDTNTCEILELGSVVINPQNLKIEDEFHSLLQPEDFDKIDPKALEINKLKIEDLEKAPLPKIVFKTWVGWINKFNPTKNNSSFKAPVVCGWNIHNFDLPIIDQYFKKFGYWDKKKDWRSPLNPIFTLDAMEFMWWLTRTNKDINRVNLSAVLEYMGLDKEVVAQKGHNALYDAQQTARIIVKILRLGNYLSGFKEGGSRVMEIKGCLSK